jgi:hypothetical protein
MGHYETVSWRLPKPPTPADATRSAAVRKSKTMSRLEVAGISVAVRL